MGYNNDFYYTTTSYSVYNNWHFVGVTFDGSTISIWIDGLLVKSGTMTYNTTGNNNYIGKPNDTNVPYTYFNGTIDDVRIFNRALNVTEIQQLYNE